MTMRRSDELYHIEELDASEARRRPDGVRDIYERKIDGLIIHNVYEAAEMRELARRIEEADAGVDRVEMPWGSTIGRVLVQSDAEEYHRIAARFRADCRQLFRGMDEFEARFEELIGQMSGGRRVEIPHHGEVTYAPFTIRLIGNGQDLSLHCGNQFLQENPAFRHLATVLDPEDQLSFFLTIAEPESGGELVLFDLEWPSRPEFIVDGEPMHKLGRYRRQAIRPPAGSVLLFDGGRIWHRVAAAAGDLTRITCGGFAAFSRDDQRVCYWS